MFFYDYTPVIAYLYNKYFNNDTANHFRTDQKNLVHR